MNILIIIANPKEDSLSFTIAHKYRDIMLKNNHNIEIIDLYRDKHQQPFFDLNINKTTKEMKYYQEKITKANELIFVFPYWWGSTPAILKNFFDWNLSKGFAFEYTNSRPKGLLNNKNVKIFVTTGAPYFWYMITGANRRLKNMFKAQIIEFCGMRLEKFTIFNGVDSHKKDSNKVSKILRTIEKQNKI